MPLMRLQMTQVERYYCTLKYIPQAIIWFLLLCQTLQVKVNCHSFLHFINTMCFWVFIYKICLHQSYWIRCIHEAVILLSNFYRCVTPHKMLYVSGIFYQQIIANYSMSHTLCALHASPPRTCVVYVHASRMHIMYGTCFENISTEYTSHDGNT